MGQGSLPAKGSCGQRARIEPEQGPKICVLQWDLRMGMTAFSDLPKVLERSQEVMGMWTGHTHTIWKCPYYWISANRGTGLT